MLSEHEFVQTFQTKCKNCGKEFTARLTQEDVDDGCADGTLICETCLEDSVDLSKLYKFLGRKPN